MVPCGVPPIEPSGFWLGQRHLQEDRLSGRVPAGALCHILKVCQTHQTLVPGAGVAYLVVRSRIQSDRAWTEVVARVVEDRHPG
jgi:hypothetical protein